LDSILIVLRGFAGNCFSEQERERGWKRKGERESEREIEREGEIER